MAGIEADAAEVSRLWTERRTREEAVAEHRAAVERAAREAEWLRHAVDELGKLAAQPGEETTLAERRATMMQAEKVSEDLRATHDSVSGPSSPVPPLATAVRRLERRATQVPALIEPIVKAIDAALNALEEARQHLEHALRVADYDPAELERIEERLFALRAAGRKYNVPVDNLAALAQRYDSELALIDAGAEQLTKLEREAQEAVARYRAASQALSAARQRTAQKLDKAVNAELEAAQARTGTVLHVDGKRERRPKRPRPHRILGAHQSRHAAGPADEDRLGRRARALSARAQSGAGRPRLGADSDLRRNRYRCRRRGRRFRSACGSRASAPAFRCSP